MIDFSTLTIKAAHELIAKRELTSRALTEYYINAIAEKNADLNVYLEVFSDALGQADAADAAIAAGEPVMVLTGIPIAIKDNILIKGKKASSASKILGNYVGTYDATVVKKLKEQKAVLIGRVNMDEFAMGGSTENSAFGPTKNPVDPTRVPGGSSGGSAAAVAGDMALAALGSDTGGSIRQPASFCGVVGLKPTYGAVSRYGLMAMASSLDQIGPIVKSVDDAEIMFAALAGRDPLDSTSLASSAVASKAGPYVVGVPFDFLGEGLDPEVKANFEASLEKLKAKGHTVKEISLPALKYSLACYYVLMPAEASTNLARFDGVRYGALKEGANLLEDYLNSRGQGFGREVRRRIMLGTYVLSAGYYDAYYHKANDVRRLIAAEYRKAFETVDVIATPTAPSPAFKLGSKTSDPLQMYLEDIFTVPVNLAGVPAISVPSGKTAAGLPLGIQFTAPHFGEQLLFAIGRDIEHN
ncbi:MAG TPA: Asp-tRNA(Asn)/Glu-tRNA(Gln) amidotransferase subunit GatA [Candidatus Paceibacterota bacterium]|nr:Asp-tRNA(Asn)/Glu-tRNA(Gln) amidotransferase subunit GatA [Candidatus Paceibacterota bacterium]